jgi:2-keto-3-deoxy-6-phosphogluconate aldolase/sugar/nucleoside kinase (ribokinase family)
MVEVVTLGEAMLRTVDSTAGRLQTVGGAELNVAVALAQLGRKARWLSAVGDDAAGWRILDEASRVGVDTTSVLILPQHSSGEYSVDHAATKVEYQRADSAFANLSHTMLKPSLRQLLGGAKWLHLTGITPLLGNLARGVWSTALATAELDGIKISLDFNHRSGLGEWDELWRVVEPHLRKIHLLTLSESDLENINRKSGLLNGTPTIEEMVEAVRSRWLVTWVACTVKRPQPDGSQSRWSTVAGPDGVVSTRETPTSQCPVEPLGGGDAWLAALLDGMLDDMALEDNLIRADRYAALVQTSPGDLSTITKSQLDGDFTDATLERLKSAKTIAILRGTKPDLMVERAKELVAAGITALEITLDSTSAFATLQRLRAELPPDILLGVGTVSRPLEQLPEANSHGAVFCLAANFPEDMISVAENLQMLPVVGAADLDQVAKAVAAGARAVKLFHAEHDWDEGTLSQCQVNHPDITFVPVGGVGLGDRARWESLGFTLLGMGEKLAGSDLKA